MARLYKSLRKTRSRLVELTINRPTQRTLALDETEGRVDSCGASKLKTSKIKLSVYAGGYGAKVAFLPVRYVS
jgi:hypothetical protein